MIACVFYYSEKHVDDDVDSLNVVDDQLWECWVNSRKPGAEPEGPGIIYRMLPSL